jgi:predicted kinase
MQFLTVRPRLLFFCGHAGTGKTTLAKRLIRPLMYATGQPFCMLDKDTLYGNYSSAVMGALTGDPNDRDSPTYLQHLRDPEYQGLLDVAREQLALGISVMVVGPLSREVKARHLHRHDWLKVPADITVEIVWVHVDEEVARQRIEKRGNPNDAYKLAHWDEYRLRRFDPHPAEYPELIRFNNSAPTDAGLAELLRVLAG